MNFTFAKCTSPYLAFLHRDTLSGKILVAEPKIFHFHTIKFSPGNVC